MMKRYLLLLVMFFALPGCAQYSRTLTSGDVEILRTTDGIPHIKAKDWFGVGYGFGYAQTEDNFCTLAEAFITYRGQRSFYWGANAKPRHDATFGRSSNLDLDIFFRAFIDDAIIEQYRNSQSKEIKHLVEGFAAGYNHYLAIAEKRECTGAPWLKPISPRDVYRRMYAAGLAAGYAKFIPEIVNAQPPSKQEIGLTLKQYDYAKEDESLLARFASKVGSHQHLGSNVIAFGGEVTGEKQSVLFGNPHWYWGGPDRFYQVHLIIPGRLNVAGASLLGAPVVMIGFNEQVAWSHTVSTARRYGLFELTLSADDPTQYLYEGKMVSMTRKIIEIQVRDENGNVTTVTRNLYRSKYGPVIDFGKGAAPLGWNHTSALTIRDINANNFQIFETYLRWNQAKSLDEFVAIQLNTVATPWVNTAAIGRNSKRVWFADIGRIPYVTDELKQNCKGALAPIFSKFDPVAPLLDGSRAKCNWLNSDKLTTPGAMPSERMPSLHSEKYVANMNDSYWLTQPAKPIEGLDSILGGERQPLLLRGQAGHQLAIDLSKKHWGSAKALNQELRTAALDAKAHSAVRFKDSLLDGVCHASSVTVRQDILTGETFGSPQTIKIDSACGSLSQWSGGGNANDKGSLLWDALWQRVRRIPSSELYSKPFSSLDPLGTPAVINNQNPRVAEALGAAIISMEKKGVSMEASRGTMLNTKIASRTLELYGGCSLEGYLMVLCNGSGGYSIDDTSFGNTYMQIVSFGDDGVEAYTLMAHGQDERALSGGPGGESVIRYADKQWLRLPFSEKDIAKSSSVKREMLRFRKSETRR